MKISSVAKKAMAVTLTVALAVGAVAVAPAKKVSAAKKKPVTITAKALYADSAWTWVAGDDNPVTKKVKITKGKKATVSITINNKTKKKLKEAQVFTVDLVDIKKNFKSVKVSGLTVKVDGKKKAAKLVQGCFEPKKNPNNWRISVYNAVGTDGDNSKSVNKAKNYKFKNKIEISFTVVAK